MSDYVTLKRLSKVPPCCVDAITACDVCRALCLFEMRRVAPSPHYRCIESNLVTCPVATARGNLILLTAIRVAYLLTSVLILLADVYPHTRLNLCLLANISLIFADIYSYFP
jgi:hypothetical protein